eukprot:m.22335 g.22335  ORF g.22335 m.22335 type:complete len:70 (+) comp12670_c0_seq1:161-370(+)
MFEQWINSPNKVPQHQNFFQGNPSRFVFEKTTADRTVYKFMMIASAAVIVAVGVGVYQLAEGKGKKPRR